MNPAASERESFRCEESNFAVKVSIVTLLYCCLQYLSSALGQIWRDSKYISLSARFWFPGLDEIGFG